jgi:hypothetical protein
MAKPLIHAKSSARKFGGDPEDYLEIHDFLDSSKSAFPDNRHRALTHNSWFIFVCERVFGHVIVNSNGKEVSVRDVCEQHILEDYGNKFIPTVSDYLEGMEFQPWMNNAKEGVPTSHRKIARKVRERKVLLSLD